MKTLIDWLIGWPERVAQHLGSGAPLFARIVVGWVFLWSGWGKLNNLPAMIENFASWHIPAPHILTPFVSGVEFFGGIFLLLGLLTRVSAGALGSSVARTNLAHASTELSSQQRTERYTIRIANFGGDLIHAGITGLQQMHRAFHAQVLEV